MKQYAVKVTLNHIISKVMVYTSADEYCLSSLKFFLNCLLEKLQRIIFCGQRIKVYTI